MTTNLVIYLFRNQLFSDIQSCDRAQIDEFSPRVHGVYISCEILAWILLSDYSYTCRYMLVNTARKQRKKEE